jgi:hypothetical protein
MCKGITSKGKVCKNKTHPWCFLHNPLNSQSISDLVCHSISSKITNFGKLVSNQMINVASKRIFGEPEQSIIELIVNSVDSYNIENKNYIGKFGMGFFSIIYWLNENKDRKLMIQSKPISEDEYTILIQFIDDELTASEIKSYDLFYKQPSGTKISMIDPNFDKSNIEKFEKWANNLTEIENVDIYINNKCINNLNPNLFNNSIIVCICENLFFVLDYGSGIKRDILYNSLLVPSSSSKVSKVSDYTNFPKLNFKIKEDKEDNSFHILVGNVSIVNIKKEEDDINIKCYKYMINLPINSLLPVSREDIIYNENSIELLNLKTQLYEMIDYIIKTPNFKNLIPILELLDLYIQKNNNKYLYSLILELKEYIYNKKDIILIPNDKVFKILNLENFIYHPYPNMYITENKLFDNFYKISLPNIFKFKSVIIIDDEKFDKKVINYSNFGLINFLFVAKSFTEKKNWETNMMLSNTSILLYPIDYDEDVELIYNNNCYPISFPENIIKLIKIGKLSCVRKFGNFLREEKKESFNSFIERIVFIYYYSFKSDNYEENKILDNLSEFLTLFINKLSNYTFKLDYGYRPFFNFSFFKNFINSKYSLLRCNIPKKYKINNKLKILMLNIKKKVFEFFISSILKKFETRYPYIQSLLNYSLNSYQTQPEELRNEIYTGLSECIYTIEYMIFCFIINNFINENDYIDLSCLFGIGKYLSYLIKSLDIPQNFDIDDRNSFEIKVINPIYMKIVEYYNTFNEEKIINNNLLKSYTNKFTCKSLIYYIFNNKYDKTTFMDKVKPLTKKMNLQILEIAVNTGTVKPFYSSVLTELFQNSLDAIRSTKDSNNKLEFFITSNSLTIKDYIGFDNYIYLLIPFLSSKNSLDNNFTGEMGTGFFNVYRQPNCDSVFIRSVYCGILTEILAIPIIQDEKVYDIEYTINKKPVKEVNSTLITINLKENEKLIETIIDMKIFIRNFMGIIDNVYLNNEKIEKKITKIYEEKDIGEVYFIESHQQNSYVLTNGVPFLELETFCKKFDRIYPQFIEMCGINVIINFNKNVYTPTQSRTQVNIKDSNKINIIKFINNGLFYASISQFLKNNILIGKYYVRNFFSKVSIDQLKFSTGCKTLDNYPSIKTLNNNIFKHILIDYNFNNINISTDINLLIKNILSNLTNKKNIITHDNLYEFLKKYTNSKKYNPIILDFYYEWFKTKDLKPIEIKIDEETQIYDETLSIFIEEYWKLLKKSKTINLSDELYPTPPKVYIQKNKSGFDGVYLGDKNEIHLSPHFEKDNIDLLESIKKCKKSKDKMVFWNTNQTIQKYFNPIFPSTILHELGHAIQKQSCGKVGAHGLSGISIGNGERLEFNDMCIQVFIELVNDGLINNFLKKIN